jgi:hypothetical protein
VGDGHRTGYRGQDRQDAADRKESKHKACTVPEIVHVETLLILLKKDVAQLENFRDRLGSAHL